ncbi:hypothetical protein COW36_12200 [bacterium (Candidatus Blackallbacteria) CG17_big_fil_post_rev_8_21_14_2_50_48_46]|uniref:DUF4230 domain-containing protein n=1 Tax=bacterium (Candidatus Blackallbacteria) CG17_big_fil_post_rev_8_21_14_2_50_48_46 TaxID=2014261 RepID=A0A2M7G424_9BACT|nr:MAG: hypothetical protein COW64_03060 [bacterium (Candidatus Blackallbacteria) CG18_big_fil_WC_8_21_14_2_50_49_26]PIW16521.1 MAG: hypothetical protein COW36_12200 [bacterium (Candidatus Blackallbacteria) CG17_big_fil_post_rev_8_21_14_2_50_48_46]PIW46029.1 MAG: hypothetical protein COW20_17465 [bacterium (Candidatus Blackallbacteria) CG13_big_fil_rev_8_21_14_2_50_49_14]
MQKPVTKDLFSVIVMTIGISALALACLLFWLQGQSTSRRPQVILERLKNLQNLEVLQAQLVGTQSFREGASIPFGHHEVVVLARGRAVYGVNLEKAQIAGSGKDLKLELPRVEVLHVILNPDSINFAAPQKSWFTTQEEFEIFRTRAANQMQIELNKQSRSPELMAEAEKQATRWLTLWLENLGFHDAKVRFKYTHAASEALQSASP